MMSANPPRLLPGVDRAAFAVALTARLRAAGARVAAGGPAGLVQALDLLPPTTRSELYWLARLTLISRADDLTAFDAVFAAVFADAALPLGPSGPQPALRSSKVAGSGSGPAVDATRRLPWIDRRPAATAVGESETDNTMPDALPSRLVARADEPFERFDPADLRLLGSWLQSAVPHWPRRRSMRREVRRHGKRIDLRRTLAAARRTGWETLLPVRTRVRRRPRRVVLACDVSRSMQPYATMYLHLMRAAAHGAGMHTEVFAFSTSLTRLTAVLTHRSPEVALQRVNAAVTDRYGGTRLGHSIAALLAPPRGSTLRGAVVIIASDGWDSDPPEVLDHAMARLRRRAKLIVWLNPRAARPGFQPLAGSMATALPYCDLFLPAASLTGLRELFTVLAAADHAG